MTEKLLKKCVVMQVNTEHAGSRGSAYDFKLCSVLSRTGNRLVRLRFFVVFLNFLKLTLAEYLLSATTISVQITSNSSLTNHLAIRLCII